MTFEEWWENQWDVPVPMTTDFIRSVYEVGWDACRDKWGGMDYEETSNDF